MKILLTVAYDGTNYGGWQYQKNAPSVQAEIEKALFSLYREEIRVKGASRTDSGVHAAGQRCAFFSPKPRLTPVRLPLAINNFLPDDIVVSAAREVPEDFDPVGDVTRKTYEYRVINAQYADPFTRRYACHVHKPLDFGEMQSALTHFVGRHDFSAFCASGNSTKSTVREIYDASLSKNGGRITLSVTGNGFLYNMVRIIAGTLIYVGLRKIPAGDIPSIIAGGDRTAAGITAEAKGLSLVEIFYK